MKIVALELERAGFNRARALMTGARRKVAAAGLKTGGGGPGNVDHASL